MMKVLKNRAMSCPSDRIVNIFAPSYFNDMMLNLKRQPFITGLIFPVLDYLLVNVSGVAIESSAAPTKMFCLGNTKNRNSLEN